MKTILGIACLVFGLATSAMAEIQAQMIPVFAGGVIRGGNIVGTINVGQPCFGTATGGTYTMTMGTVYRWQGVTGVAGEDLPIRFALWQNTPNPAQRSTMIRYDIPKGNAVPVRLDVYDVGGRIVANLVNNSQSPGHYMVRWDQRANPISSGVYWYRLSAGTFSSTKKLVILN